MTVTELAAAAFALLLVGSVVWRAVDDAEHPKLVLAATDWACRSAHPELGATPSQNPDGSAGRVITATLVCDIWSRR